MILAGLFPRGRELGLLCFPAAFLILASSLLSLVQNRSVRPTDLASAGAVLIAIVGVHAWLSRTRPHADPLLFPMAAMLAAIGQTMVARLAPELATRQTTWILLGLMAMVGVQASLPSLDVLRRYRYTWAALGLLLVGATLVFGTDTNNSGARLWFRIAGVSFQPSELLKLVLVVFLASYLDEYRELLAFAGPRIGPVQLPPLPYLFPLGIMLAVTQGLLLAQRDLGAGLLLFLVFVIMIYLASGRVSFVAGGFGLFLGTAWVAYQAFDHVRLRVAIWLDPWAHSSGPGYQVVQALIALGNGGLLGTGIGQGSPTSIPAVHTDFVIAAVGEELGLLGSLAVVVLYMVFCYRSYRVALGAPGSFQQLLAAGLASAFAIQVLIILGGTLKVIPLTGITLPWISYGGSSVLVNFIMLGLLLMISEAAEGGDGE